MVVVEIRRPYFDEETQTIQWQMRAMLRATPDGVNASVPPDDSTSVLTESVMEIASGEMGRPCEGTRSGGRAASPTPTGLVTWWLSLFTTITRCRSRRWAASGSQTSPEPPTPELARVRPTRPASPPPLLTRGAPLPRTATSDITSIAVGGALRSARLEIGITQQELASRLNVSAPYLSSIENGRMNMTIGQLSAIANALGAILDVTFRVPAPMIEPEIPQPPEPATLLV